MWYDKPTMIKRVSDSYRNNIIHITLSPLIKLIEAVFDLLIPLFMKTAIDLGQYHNVEDIPNQLTYGLAKFVRLFPPINENQALSDALIVGIIILIMGVIGYSLTMIAQYIAARTAVKVSTEVRDSLFTKIMSLSKKDKDRIGSSRLQTSLNSDTYQIQQAVLLFVRLIVRAPFILIGSLVFSYILDWRIGLAFTATVPLILLVIFIVLHKAEKNYVVIQQNLDDLSLKSNDTIEGARVIRAFKKEDEENKGFEDSSSSYQDKAIRVNKINALINPLTFAITAIVLIVILFILEPSLINGDQVEKTIISSTMIAEMAYLSQIFFVTVQITGALLDVTKGVVASKRVDEILAIENDIVSGTSLSDNNASYLHYISYNHVYFTYKDNSETYALKDIDFSINKGQTLGIIGGTGSGKSSIIHLLERFYDVSKGEIIYKDKSIKDYCLESLRNDIGLVNQKSSLFKGDIKSNLLMSNSLATSLEMDEALKEAQAYDFIYEKEGLDTLVEEGGVNFSGGQRQRLCIARALLRNPEILILDDSTSALDLLTDKNIRTTMSNKTNMTKIIVSQRVSTIMDADLILVLDQGEIVGKGNHTQLLNSCPIYKEIYESQIKKG